MDNKNMKSESDPVNHPDHYNQYQGFEVIEVCEQLRSADGSGNFNRGNAFKYLARAGWKNPSKEVEDLEKAVFYITREIERVSKQPKEKIPQSDSVDFNTVQIEYNTDLGFERMVKYTEEQLRLTQASMTDIGNKDADKETVELRLENPKDVIRSAIQNAQLKFSGADNIKKYTSTEFQARMKAEAPYLFDETDKAEGPDFVAPLCPQCGVALILGCSEPVRVYFCAEGHGQMIMADPDTKTRKYWVGAS